jgi:uncharacterized protein (DUF488 family)
MTQTHIVFTIGHSNRPLPAFIEALTTHAVTCLVDIRSFPRSRHNPQFNTDTLPEDLQRAGIGYEHRKALGGRRKPLADSRNGGWRNKSFQGYADYMQAPEFNRQIDELIELSRRERIVLMCAEAVPWRCHRSLVADALVARNVTVEHIFDARRTQTHRLTSWAQVRAGRVSYPFVLHE